MPPPGAAEAEYDIGSSYMFTAADAENWARAGARRLTGTGIGECHSWANAPHVRYYASRSLSAGCN
jgi:hypothetical protein